MTTPIIRLRPDGDPKTGLQPCRFVDSANTFGAPPAEIGHTFFTNAAGTLTAGVWEATPYRERIDGYPVDELMLILEGSVIITDANGARETFSPGDAFIMPKGFKGMWESTETVRKYYMLLE